MKKVSLILSAALVTGTMVTSCGVGASNEAEEPTDSATEELAEKSIDLELTSNEASNFKEVTIGNQVWMAENLNVDTFRNGDPIPHAKTQIEWWEKTGKKNQPAWCYYHNDPKNGEKYGKLYNWYAVNDPRGLAPEGWHIPSDEEWTELTDYLGGESVAGEKMKSTNGWEGVGKDTLRDSRTHELVIRESSGNYSTNESGFSGLPGGHRDDIGQFDYIGFYGDWWSSTADDAGTAWGRDLDDDEGDVDRDDYRKAYGLSVRCLRD